MEFFDHAIRLSRYTPVYVTGPVQQRAKLEAACRRGARMFDALSLEEHCRPVAEIRPQWPRNWPEPESREPDAAAPPPAEAEDANSQDADDGWGDQPVSRSMPVQSCRPWSSPVRLAESYDEAPGESDEVPCESGGLQASSSPQELADAVIDEPPQAPADSIEIAPEESISDNVVEVTDPIADNPVEVADESGVQEVEVSDEIAGEPGGPPPGDVRPEAGPAGSVLPDDDRQGSPDDSGQDRETPVVFPWSAVPNRPKRTPPNAAGPADSGGQANAPAAREPARPTVSGNWADPPFRSVRLTAEEIAALMGPTQPPPSSPEAHS
jgi:hypothetical protein